MPFFVWIIFIWPFEIGAQSSKIIASRVGDAGSIRFLVRHFWWDCLCRSSVNQYIFILLYVLLYPWCEHVVLCLRVNWCEQKPECHRYKILYSAASFATLSLDLAIFKDCLAMLSTTIHGIFTKQNRKKYSKGNVIDRLKTGVRHQCSSTIW